MCEQCLTAAEPISRTALPGITVMQARKGIDTWPEGWYGFVDCNDPFLVFEGPLVANALAEIADEDWDALTAEQEAAYENFHQAALRLGKSLETLPAMTGYFVVKACMDAGYQPEKHGHAIEYWLMHHLATATQSTP